MPPPLVAPVVAVVPSPGPGAVAAPASAVMDPALGSVAGGTPLLANRGRALVTSAVGQADRLGAVMPGARVAAAGPRVAAAGPRVAAAGPRVAAA